MTLFQVLSDPEHGAGIPVTYSHFRDDETETPVEPPYLVYIGAGQDTSAADNTYIYHRNRYQIGYYFIEKDEDKEAAIEKLLTDNGYLYEKSDDEYIEELGIFVIYYDV